MEEAIEEFNGGARTFQSLLSNLVLGVEKEREELRQAQERLEKEREALEFETHRVQQVRSTPPFLHHTQRRPSAGEDLREVQRLGGGGGGQTGRQGGSRRARRGGGGGGAKRESEGGAKGQWRGDG